MRTLHVSALPFLTENVSKTFKARFARTTSGWNSNPE